MESSYNKYLSLFGSEYYTQPLLSKYKDRMEIFPNFFSDFASSIHARFATFTSLYPVRDYNAFTIHRVGVKSLFEVLHDNGYASSLFYSSFFEYTGFGDFLKNRGIDEMYDANNMPGARGAENVSWGLKEETTLVAIRQQIKKYHQTGQRFFLTYVPAAPHYPYDNIPKQFRKFKKLDLNDYTPVYLNDLLYMDWVISSIVDQLAQSGLLDQTLVIITNDHGEMLGGKDENVGHGWAFSPELANTPLIIMDPKNPGCRFNYAVGSQVDFLPTVLDRLNLPLPVGQLYQGRSLDRSENRDDRSVYLNTIQQFGVLHGNQISVGDRDSNTPGFKNSSFTISNDGAKTVFTSRPPLDKAALSINSFDAFQENLLRNYSLYCQSLCKQSGPAGVINKKSSLTTARASQ
jgi:phosphoglycerol transferase MdoB-like AlkP superfamily enzyme